MTQRPAGKLRLITCLSRQGIAKKDVVIPDDTRFDIAPGETLTLCDIHGPGRIARFWVALPVFGRGPVLRSAVLRIHWDDEEDPSVECPLGDFFGVGFAHPKPFVSDRLQVSGGGYVCQFEMPFRNRAIVTIENQSCRRLRLLVFQVAFYEEDPSSTPGEEPETFHAQWRRQNPTTNGKPYVALEASGSGRVVGLKMDMQNRSWWLKPPLGRILFPRGLGLGMLEGPERLVVDGDDASAMVGTGTEDFFGGGWYFMGREFRTPTHGATTCSFLLGRVSAYRFFVNDPIPFAKSISVAFDHGIDNGMPTDHSSVAYWYQREPHARFPALPSEAGRRPVLPVANLLQPMLLAGSFLSLLGAAAGLLAYVAFF